MPDLNILLKSKKSIKSVCEHVRTKAQFFGSFVWGYCIRIASYLHWSVMHRSVMHWRSMGKGAMHRSARDCAVMH